MQAKLTQSCLTLCNPVDCSPPGSSVLGILQARILEGVAMPFSKVLSHPGVKPESLISLISLLPLVPPGKPKVCLICNQNFSTSYIK